MTTKVDLEFQAMHLEDAASRFEYNAEVLMSEADRFREAAKRARRVAEQMTE